jgi:hypothetical protein
VENQFARNVLMKPVQDDLEAYKKKMVYIFLQCVFNKFKPLLSTMRKSLRNIKRPFSNFSDIFLFFVYNISLYYLYYYVCSNFV